jgi:uncharacterized protein involved in exopolysaccharide biosynthesis
MQDTTLPLFTLRDLQAVVRRRRRVIAMTFAAVFVPAAVATLLMPPTYRASARLLLQRDGRSPAFALRSTPQADGNATFRQVDQKEELATESELLRSRAVVQPVVDRLQLSPERLNQVRDFRRYVRGAYDWTVRTFQYGYNEFRYATGLSTRPSAADVAQFERIALLDDVLSRLRLTTATDSNVIELSFTASDAVLARDVANAIVDEYLRRRADASIGGARRFFRDQSDRTGGELREREDVLDRLERRYSAYSIDEQRKFILASLTSTDDRLRDTRTTVARLSAKAAAIERQLTGEPETLTTSRDVQRNPAFDLVGQKVVELELERAKLLEKNQPTSPAVVNVEAQLATARQLQAQLPKTLDGSATNAINPVRQSLRTDLLQAQGELAAAQSQERALASNLASYRRDLDRLNESALQVRGAQRLVEAQEQAYAIYLRNQEQARVTEAMNASDLSSLKLVDAAPLPLYAIAPRPRIYLGAALAAALLMAFAAALLAEHNDATVGRASQLPPGLDLEVLATFPTAPLLR